MKTDSLFYQLFQSTPSVFFELMGKSAADAEGYQFASVEVKQSAFRLDGVLLPSETAPDTPAYFVEIQFQRDALLYRRLWAEILIYLRQHPQVEYWQTVVVYPNSTVEVRETGTLAAMLQPPFLQTIYLNELDEIAELPLGLAIVRLIIEPTATMPQTANRLVGQIQRSPLTTADREKFVELIQTILVYAFPRLTHQEIAAMLEVTDLRQTRVYQEGREEGREDEAKSLVFRILHRKLGSLTAALQTQVGQLDVESLEQLGEALIDFSEAADLQAWLDQHVD